MEEFETRNRALVARMASDSHLNELSRDWFLAASQHEYSYHFKWLGRPIIQFPQDMLAIQELIWSVRPDVIIETGIAHGGSLIFSASLLELLGGNRQVVGIDIDIRPHNRLAIEQHPLFKKITMIEGSSIDPRVVQEVREVVRGRRNVLALLDSNHTSDHVLQELELYSPFVHAGSYVVVFDTIIDLMPESFAAGRSWGPGQGPLVAVEKFLRRNNRFEVDKDLERKLLITVAPGGYLRCVRG